MTNYIIPKIPGFTHKQNVDAWRLRMEVVDAYITNGMLDNKDLEQLAKMKDDISRTILLTKLLNDKGKK